MTRARSSIYPNVPHSLRELGELLARPGMEVISMTLDGDDSIFACACACDDGSWAVLLSTKRILRFMGRITHVFADGTFCTPSLPQASQVSISSSSVSYHALLIRLL